MPSAGSHQDLRADIKIKDEIESEIGAICEYLKSNGVPGLHGGLVDAEGFPRADIDVHAIRTNRQRLACLQTDHQAVMRRIEAGLVQAIPAKPENTPAAAPVEVPAPAPAAPEEPIPKVVIIAIVTEVTADSPAATAGLAVDDLVISFGTAKHPSTVMDIATVVRNSENVPVRIEVLREGSPHSVSLVPRSWAGQGLLGARLNKPPAP